MKLETAILIPGTESPVGDGLTQATRCVLALTDGTRRAAILKRLPRQSVLAEAFSALLLRAWGLTVPQPFLVPGQDGAIYFASADAAYPSLKQRLGIKDLPEGPLKDALILAACHIVAALAQTPLAIVADEAIDNRDRNLGNILWDGAEAAWIDHELALGLAQNMPDINKLAEMVKATGDHEPVKKSVIAAWMALDREAANLASTTVQTPDLASMVATRLTLLGGRLLHRFPLPKDLLSKA